jgi:hypothetical protein
VNGLSLPNRGRNNTLSHPGPGSANLSRMLSGSGEARARGQTSAGGPASPGRGRGGRGGDGTSSLGGGQNTIEFAEFSQGKHDWHLRLDEIPPDAVLRLVSRKDSDLPR